MQTLLRSLVTFYKSFALLTLIINVFCIAIIVVTEFRLFPLMFWFRATVHAIIFYFINDYKKKEFYYYQNLGISKNTIWAYIVSFDLAIFLLVNYIIYAII
ncbi:hypothetical protein [Daejeonella lutea]|uniref:Uncharacterized protein n=1 Tax=Daejeonella lutea TaxID=572036 RepID=A0A1T5AQD1_9SPHI|nr:hypothetical protein [Daejeonella lutea]SKB37085.1 hypothetical protein SAMN05661099_0933 [Daejeonella lutea]